MGTLLPPYTYLHDIIFSFVKCLQFSHSTNHSNEAAIISSHPLTKPIPPLSPSPLDLVSPNVDQ